MACRDFCCSLVVVGVRNNKIFRGVEKFLVALVQYEVLSYILGLNFGCSCILSLRKFLMKARFLIKKNIYIYTQTHISHMEQI